MRWWLVSLIVFLGAPSARGEEGEPEPVVAPVVVPPRLKQFVHAQYPEGAAEDGREAAVDLLVVVDVEGKVSEITLQQGAGPAFDEAAMTAVRQFEFEPATIDGQPVAVRIGYTYRFKIEKKEVKKEPGQSVMGVVKEKGVGLPIVAAEVAVVGRARTTTDKKGRFSLKNIEPGVYKVIVTNPEYKRLEAELTVEEGKTLEVELALETVLENPYEVVVRGKKQETVVTKYVLEQRTLETVPGTFGDPVRVVETLPGVARSIYGVGMLIVRGAMPYDSKVFVDGVEVPLIYHFFGGPSVLNPNLLESIGYYPGNFPTKYGGALAGIVDVTPKTRKVEQWAGELDVNLINVSGFVGGKVGEDTSFRLGARRSYVDGVIWAAMKLYGEDGTVVAPRFWDLQAQVGHDINDRNRLSLFWLGSHDAIELVTTSEEDDMDIDLNTATDFHRVIGSWRYSVPHFSTNFRPFFGWDSFNFETLTLNMDTDLYIIGARFDVEYEPVEWFALSAGLVGGAGFLLLTGELPQPQDHYHPGFSITGRGMDNAGDFEKYEMDETYWKFAPYFDLKFRPLPSLSVTPGFRLDVWHHPGGTIPMWDPRLVVRWEAGGGVVLKGGVGRFSKAPDPGNTEEVYGNPDLDYQWAMHYSGGLEWTILDAITLDVQGFYVGRKDLVTFGSGLAEDEEGNVQSASYTNGGWGRSYGMELMLKHEPTKRFYGWLSYTLSRSELAGYSQVMGGGEEGGDSGELQLSPFDQTHILSLVASVRLGRGWETGARVRLVSGNPSTPIVGGRFVGDDLGFRQIAGGVRSERLSPFFQLDARVEKKWTFESWVLSCYLDVQNVTDHANTEFVSWDYRFRDSWEVPGIPFFPSLGLSGKF